MRSSNSVELMNQAMEMLVEALKLLDEAGAPADIGAHVDMGRARLSSSLELTRMSSERPGAVERPAA